MKKRMEENEINVLLKFNEMQRWQAKFQKTTWLHINQETAHQTTITCTKITELKIYMKNSVQIKMQV